jgi:ABC-type uncharacterized transport system YnjBCD permease subunit
VADKNIYSLLADLVLLVHIAFVAFVVVGLVVIWVGHFCRWSFVHDLRFRMAHLQAMGLVLTESLTNVICPLTTWENQLRIRAGDGTGYSGSFIRHWFGRILFHDWSEQTFTLIYIAFFLFVAFTFLVVRPRRRQNRQRD